MSPNSLPGGDTKISNNKIYLSVTVYDKIEKKTIVYCTYLYETVNLDEMYDHIYIFSFCMNRHFGFANNTNSIQKTTDLSAKPGMVTINLKVTCFVT